MITQWVRSYRPDPDRWDERPAVLGGGYVTADPEDLELFVTQALAKGGNVIIQRPALLSQGIDEARHTTARFREAEQAERRS